MARRPGFDAAVPDSLQQQQQQQPQPQPQLLVLGLPRLPAAAAAPPIA